ncbi:DNA-directed RNA polymerase III subunit RPC4, partial [Tremellales sp. Uapishka_1]
MSGQDIKPNIRPKPSLIAAAESRASTSTPVAMAAPSSAPMAKVGSATTVSAGSSRATPAPSEPGDSGAPVQKLKFKPKIPVRRVKQEVEVKAEPATRGRGAPRGRGRGAGRGRAVTVQTVAAGPLGGPRPVASSSRRPVPAPAPPRRQDPDDVEVYSDHSDQENEIIDIDAVSGLGESAPTSLTRARAFGGNALGGKLKGKMVKAEKAKAKKKKMDDEAGPSIPRVKAEPLSPIRQMMELREDDEMRSEDEEQDRDERGVRVRAFAKTGGNDEVDDEVNAAQAVDLSDSESEDEEESMEGDFIAAPGMDNPEDKLFIFQFPHLFPKFTASGPVDLSAETESKEGIKDVKPTPAALARAKREKEKNLPPPEGKIGTLVVMKSGKVKMVLGNDVVMNVSSGVPATFLQQLVHVDQPSKAAVVLGEVHKQYVVTPDIDRLLNDLYLNGGITPGDKEIEERRRFEKIVKAEKGLIRMDD